MSTSTTIPEPKDLTEIRARIDRLDTELVQLIAQRLRLADETLDIKEAHGLSPSDGRREAAVVARSARLARDHGLDAELVREIFWRLIELSRSSARVRSVAAAL